MTLAPKIVLTRAERATLEELATRNAADHPAVLRARIILAAARDLSRHEIAKETQVRTKTVTRWCNAFLEQGLDGIRDQGKSLGRKPLIWKKEAPRILFVTRNVYPPNGRRWTCRSLADHLGVSISLVQRVWKSEGIDPAMLRDFVAAPPFQPGERRCFLGAYFCGSQRAVAAEILASGAAPPNGKQEDPIVFACHGPDGQAAISSPRVARMQVDHQLCFLETIFRRAQPSSSIRVITDGAHSFSHSRVRRWISRCDRLTLHHSTAARTFLLEAEAEYRARMSSVFVRSLAERLTSMPQEGRGGEMPPLHGAVAYPNGALSPFQFNSLS